MTLSVIPRKSREVAKCGTLYREGNPTACLVRFEKAREAG